jgi:hypothetical protein
MSEAYEIEIPIIFTITNSADDVTKTVEMNPDHNSQHHGIISSKS